MTYTSYYSQHAQLYEQHYLRLFRTMLSITRSPELAEDIVQEAFVHLLQAYPHYLKEKNTTGLINTIVKHTMIDRLRHEQVVREHLTELEEWHHDLPDNELADPQIPCTDQAFLAYILDKLSPEQRRLLILLEEGYSYVQIAAQVGKDPNVLKMYIKRARDAARMYYQQALEEAA